MSAQNQMPLVPRGYQLARFDQLDSTNLEARRRAADLTANASPIWLVAAEQSAGRGRHGRHWHSPRGNLFATLLLPRMELRRAHELAFVAGLALRAALADFVPPPHRLELKWPNDILLDEKKLCGILLESGAPDGAGASWLALGMGVNLVAHPEESAWPATSLAHALPAAPSLEEVLAAVTHGFAAQHRFWQREGFAAVRAAWLTHAWRRGGSVQVRAGAEILRGRFRTLDASGALCLETGQGERVVLAGDMFFEKVRA